MYNLKDYYYEKYDLKTIFDKGLDAVMTIGYTRTPQHGTAQNDTDE